MSFRYFVNLNHIVWTSLSSNLKYWLLHWCVLRALYSGVWGLAVEDKVRCSLCSSSTVRRLFPPLFLPYPEVSNTGAWGVVLLPRTGIPSNRDCGPAAHCTPLTWHLNATYRLRWCLWERKVIPMKRWHYFLEQKMGECIRLALMEQFQESSSDQSVFSIT